jgi:quercetin dioxygenase-like cupin family protein
MGFAHYTVDAGSSIHEHHHPNEEVWLVVEGDFEVTVAGATKTASAGCVVVVPPDAHSVRALTSGRAIVANHPVRHDFPPRRADGDSPGRGAALHCVTTR